MWLTYVKKKNVGAGATLVVKKNQVWTTGQEKEYTLSGGAGVQVV